jgi:hypothetical protein
VVRVPEVPGGVGFGMVQYFWCIKLRETPAGHIGNLWRHAKFQRIFVQFEAALFGVELGTVSYGDGSPRSVTGDLAATNFLNPRGSYGTNG